MTAALASVLCRGGDPAHAARLGAAAAAATTTPSVVVVVAVST